MAFKKTTASIPPKVASEYARAPKPEAVAEAESDGYVKTTPMKKATGSKQYGLPKSGGVKVMKMKGL